MSDLIPFPGLYLEHDEDSETLVVYKEQEEEKVFACPECDGVSFKIQLDMLCQCLSCGSWVELEIEEYDDGCDTES